MGMRLSICNGEYKKEVVCATLQEQTLSIFV
jgi:hypothetical protein